MKKTFVIICIALLVLGCVPVNDGSYRITTSSGDVVFVDASKFVCAPDRNAVVCSSNGFISKDLAYYNVEKFEYVADD